MKKGDKCCPGGKVGNVLAAVTLVLLLLVNLEVVTGGFGTFVAAWWPVGLLVHALHGFCPCDECKM